MEDRKNFIDLYDIYKELLTIKQRQYFEDYYFNDLSLSEIGENLNVSRAIIGKTINIIKSKLLKLENILKVKEKNLLIEEFNNNKNN